MQKGIDMREQDLDDLFVTLRADPPPDSGLLTARILADAATHQPKPAQMTQRHLASPLLGFWARMSQALGGKGVLAGLGAAAVAGVMLGLAQPASLSLLTDTISVQGPIEDLDSLVAVDDFLSEG